MRIVCVILIGIATGCFANRSTAPGDRL